MARDVLVFYSQQETLERWTDALGPELPDLDIRAVAADGHYAGDPAEVRYVMVWKPPHGFFAQFPNLELVINLGAGVDALLGRDDLPDVPITRLQDPTMSRMMAAFVLFAVLRHARDVPLFETNQRRRHWQYVPPRQPEDFRVGILGLGELGARAAGELVRQGFDVRGWSRTPKTLPGVKCAHGMEALDGFLADTDILVVLLPLTPDTRGLLNADRFARMPRGASLINVARGPLVDEPALIDALGSGQLSAATLDVFAHEPLPADSPLWDMPGVLITPHLASVPIPRTAAAQVAENIRRIRRGEPVVGVDPGRGY